MAKAQFDRSEVIGNATDLFWRHGFNGASMQQVFKATGLKPGSIYLAFGNKEGLFKESLEHYANASLSLIDARFSDVPSIGEAYCDMFKDLIKSSIESDYTSCFLVKSQLELAFENKELHVLAGEQLKKIEARHYHYLKNEFDDDTSAARATSIMLHVFGIRVYGYQNASEDVLLKGLREGLKWLPWDVPTSPKINS